MSRAEELAAKAARMSQRRQTAATPQEEPARLSTPQVRARPVRKTVDLPPQRYAALTEWGAETAGALGVARVTGQDILNALVARLLADKDLARDIRNDLAEDLRRR
jgi:hypothetical protein